MASPHQLRGVLATAGRNTALLRIGAAFAAFSGTETGVWIALLLFAYDEGGSTAASGIAVAQLVPGALLAPALGSLADRRRPGRVLLLGYLVLGVAAGAVAGVIAFGGPAWLVFLLAPLVNLAICVPRPAQAALLPSVVHTPEELAAANAGQGWVENASTLVAPIFLAALLSAGGTALGLAGMAGLALVAALAVAPITGPAPFRSEERTEPAGAGATSRTGSAGIVLCSPAVARSSPEDMRRSLADPRRRRKSLPRENRESSAVSVACVRP